MPGIGNKIANADIDLVDETFDVQKSKNYHLSIQIEAGRITFCVFNTVINKYIVLRSYPLSITDLSPVTGHSLLVGACRSIFENDDLLGLSYMSSSLLWVSPRFTFVPEHLFDPKEVDLYLTFNHGVTTGEHSLHHFIKSVKTFQVFSCPREMMNLVRMYQPHVYFFNQSMPFIDSVHAGTPPSGKIDIAIYFYSYWLDIAVMKDKKLLFYNSFKIIAPADSVYYLVGVSNMFDIDLKSTKLMYAGNLQQMPPKIAILKDFSGGIIEYEPFKAVTFSHYITKPFRKNFINLFNLYGCE